MKALSTRQPWAWLIVNGYKPIENRNWRSGYRGELAIHASKTFDSGGVEFVRKSFPRIHLPDSYDMGGIVGMVNMVDCVDSSDSPWFFGKHGFVFEDANASEFISCKGRLSIFDIHRGKIEVINVRGLRGPERDGIIYVGRKFAGWPASALGNPFTPENSAEPIADYRKWLWMAFNTNPGVRLELHRIANLVKSGKDIKLGCWCHPQPCHAGVVKSCIEWMIGDGS